MKNVFIKTFGCQMNVYDSEKMMAVLNDAYGTVKTDDVTAADIILINTCSVREKAQEKLFSELGRYSQYKKKNPRLIIGVGGCVASQEGESILKRAPCVDIIFGPQTLHRIPQLIEEKQNGKRAGVDISFPEIEKFDHLPKPQADSATAFVTIMEGCSKYCSFCIVPYTRGEEISRPFDDVIAEAMELADQGVKEINLLGQNVNDYTGLMHDGTLADLAVLIHYVAAIDGIERIRFTTSHPNAFSDNLIDAFAQQPKLVDHLHLPVQSGSDRVLAMMKRNYTVLEFKERIRKLRAVRPNISLSSDFIIGFPGETEKDFQATMDLVKKIGFDHSYSFIYSARPGTPAANLADDVPMSVKKERLQQLQDLINHQAYQISRQMVGTTQSILITGTSKKNPNGICGRTENNRIVHIEGDISCVGQMIDCEITEATPHALRGKRLDP